MTEMVPQQMSRSDHVTGLESIHNQPMLLVGPIAPFQVLVDRHVEKALGLTAESLDQFHGNKALSGLIDGFVKPIVQCSPGPRISCCLHRSDER